MNYKIILRLAALCSLIVSLFQIVITFVPSWSLYFGAPAEIVSNYPLLIITGLIAAVFFIIFTLYGFSGSGDIRSLPLLRPGLLVISIIYILRGLMFIEILLIQAGIIQTEDKVPSTALASSLISLFIGLVYLIGTITGWKKIYIARNT